MQKRQAEAKRLLSEAGYAKGRRGGVDAAQRAVVRTGSTVPSGMI